MDKRHSILCKNREDGRTQKAAPRAIFGVYARRNEAKRSMGKSKESACLFWKVICLKPMFREEYRGGDKDTFFHFDILTH